MCWIVRIKLNIQIQRINIRVWEDRYLKCCNLSTNFPPNNPAIMYPDPLATNSHPACDSVDPVCSSSVVIAGPRLAMIKPRAMNKIV